MRGPRIAHIVVGLEPAVLAAHRSSSVRIRLEASQAEMPERAGQQTRDRSSAIRSAVSSSQRGSSAAWIPLLACGAGKMLWAPRSRPILPMCGALIMVKLYRLGLKAWTSTSSIRIAGKTQRGQQCLSHLCIYLCRIPDVILPV